MDVTSFHPDQSHWTSDRLHRPSVLTLWSMDPETAQTYHLGYLLFNGRLILDYAGNPIRAFRHLPLTISSAVEGFRIEAWNRQDIHRLRKGDILARLRTRVTAQGREPMYTGATILDRARFFRQKSGLTSFHIQTHATRVAAGAFLDALRTPAQRASNKAIDRDLTADELATLRDLNKESSTNTTVGSGADPSPHAPVTTPSPKVAISPAFEPIRPRLLTPTPQSVAADPPASTPAQQLPDSRDEVPKTCQDSYDLNNALTETVLHFRNSPVNKTPSPQTPLRATHRDGTRCKHNLQPFGNRKDPQKRCRRSSDLVSGQGE